MPWSWPRSTKKNGWPYEGGAADFVARVTSVNGNTWTSIRPLAQQQ